MTLGMYKGLFESKIISNSAIIRFATSIFTSIDNNHLKYSNKISNSS